MRSLPSGNAKIGTRHGCGPPPDGKHNGCQGKKDPKDHVPCRIIYNIIHKSRLERRPPCLTSIIIVIKGECIISYYPYCCLVGTLIDDVINQSEFHSFLGSQVKVAFHDLVDAVIRLGGVLCVDLIETFTSLEDLFGKDRNI